MFTKSQTVAVTTDASGDATVYTSLPVAGRILSVRYVKNNFDNGVDFNITLETTGQAVWVQSDVNASATVAPRQATHSTAGAAALYAAGGTAILDYVYAAGERVKVVVAQGGNVKSGSFVIVHDGGFR